MMTMMTEGTPAATCQPAHVLVYISHANLLSSAQGLLCFGCAASVLLLAVCTGNPPHPAKGSFDCPSSALPGNVCNATCDAGYVGAPASTCQPNGTYSDVAGSCELIGGLRKNGCHTGLVLWTKQVTIRCSAALSPKAEQSQTLNPKTLED
jgi:hypothetical protein